MPTRARSSTTTRAGREPSSSSSTGTGGSSGPIRRRCRRSSIRRPWPRRGTARSSRRSPSAPASTTAGARSRLPTKGRCSSSPGRCGQTEETLHHLFRGLIVAGPVGLLLATLGGYLLAAAALRPVESMRRRASAISATTTGARLPVPRSRDEIRDLAETLNDMLGRLEAALEHERRFVADASHELRTPLALLKAELELALRRPEERGGAARSRRLCRRGDRPAGPPRRGPAA